MNQEEHELQKALFQWAHLHEGTAPELALLYATPNAGKRSPKMGAWYKAEGLKRGVLDVHLPVARCGYHSFWIEHKAVNPETGEKGRLSPEQKWWIERLRSEGNRAEVSYSWIDSARMIAEYLGRADLIRELEMY